MLVLDFDGNLTDVEKEAKPFMTGYLADLALLLSMSLETVQRLADLAYREIAENPATHGWCYGGEIMAPATVDPYLRMNAVARKVLSENYAIPDVLLDRLSQLLFSYNYSKTDDVPKSTTLWTLLEVFRRKLCVSIVTNSGTAAVRRKLERLIDAGAVEDRNIVNWWVERVVGDARKYDPSDKPETGVKWPYKDTIFRFPGFPRTTVVKRPHYFKALDDIRLLHSQVSDCTIEWGKVLVVGDVFELDLALPYWLGCHVGLMVNDHTPSWELAFVSSNSRCRVLRSPQEIIPYYDSIQSLKT